MTRQGVWGLSMMLIAGAAVAGERVDQSLDAGEEGEVSIDVRRGVVTVVGWDEPRVAVVGTRDDHSTGFVFERDGDLIRIEDQVADDSRGGDGTRITVRMPRGHAIRADLVSAELEVDGVRGRARLRTVSGDIEARNLGDDAALRTVSGDIELEQAGRTLQFDTVSGDVDAEIQAIDLSAESVSGDLDIDNRGELERGKLSTVSGDLVLASPLATDADVSLETVSGDVTMTLRGDASARMHIDAGLSGDIDNAIRGSEGTPTRRGGSERLELKVGAGTADVEVSTLSGTVTLRN